jgi:uncharacterized protein (DUF488 family)
LSMPLPAIYTIGVFGSSEKEYFQKLIDNKIDTFCDIRQRRAVRGAEYAFVNSQRLQDKLAELGIGYIHELGLAPTDAIRNLQKKADAQQKVAYRKQVLSKFDMKKFINDLAEAKAKKVVLFCVEASASACHRSLVTEKIKRLFPAVKIEHL